MRCTQVKCQKTRFPNLFGVLLVVEMSKGPPEIRFNVISESSGVETIEKARSHVG
jgi:hypothetical protein